ncbi:MAG TPA: dihydrodipicolinate synthase, partial [Mycobacterium sp.]|nr:dihydrodipicolinate synthase [Mycobacterium sp.]
ITVQEFVDCRAVTAREMLVDLMGMGKRPDEITPDSAMFRTISSQYEQSLAATADVLGLRFDEIRREVRTASLPHDVEVSGGMLPAGSVVGLILSWTAHRSGVAVLAAEEYWTAADDIPGWDVDTDGEFLVRILVDGVPPLRVELTIGNDPIDLPGVAGGQLAVAMTAVRAIPYVLDAPPGVVIPPVFGAYRWAGATS